MAAKIQLRRDTAAVWASVNPTLALGEPGVETDTYKVKVGDGTSDWNTLPYSITTQFADLNGKPTTIAGYGITDATTTAREAIGSGLADPEYHSGAIIDLIGDGGAFFKREVTVNGVRIVSAGTVGGQTAVPDLFIEKVAQMFVLFTDPTGAGINEASQRTFIKTLSGDSGTYHAAVGPTLQRVARGAGGDYSTNFLTDDGITFWNLSPLFDSHVANDMVWYLNSTGDAPGDGDNDAQEVIEHVFHTLHMHGLDAVSLKMYSYISADWASGPLYAAMEEAYDAGKWDSSGYGGNAWKTDGDAFEVAAKEYLFLLNFGMFEYSSLWSGGSLSPEWTDDMRTPAGIQSNNPLGYALHNTYIAPVISKPSLTTIRSIFQDGDVGDPSIAGSSGYTVDTESSEVEYYPTTGAFTVNTTFANLKTTPTTIAGYGITDAYTKAEVDTIIESPSGNLTGSVFADDSSIMIDGVAGKIVGQLEVSDPFISGTIDSTDSSPITITPDVVMSAGLTIGNHIIPSSNENIDLGSASARFRDLYLSGNSAVIGDLALKRHISGGLLVADHSTGSPTNVTTHNITANDITAAGDVDVTGNLTMTGYIAGPAVFTIDPAAVGDNTGKVVIAGDLQVDGTQTTINSTTVAIDDLKLSVATDAADSAEANGAGITVGGANANITYTHVTTSWDFDKTVNVTGNIGVTGTVDGVDIAARDAILTSTTTTAGAALPKAGGTMTGTLTTPTLITGAYGAGGSAGDGFRLNSTDLYGQIDATDKIRLTVNGDSFLNGGNVGIGTAAPDALLHVSDTSPHIDIGPQGSNRGKIGYHDLDVIIGSTSSTGEIIFKNNIGSTDAPQDSGDVKMTIADVGLTIHSDTYNILNLQTDSNNDQTSTDGIIKITNNDGSSDVTKAEFRWDESEDLVHVSYGDHGRHISIGSDGKVGIATGSTAPSQTLDVNGTTIAEQYLLDAIDKDISDTAVDVFVYDTRKDSDGGAWRKRTQHTSWYNEALNTSTRGARKEFPSVAVIVAESNQLTIYDGDDPDMPMWMVFNNSDDRMLGSTPTAAVVKNGALWVALNGYGVSEINFIKDEAWRHRNNVGSNYYGKWHGGITTRNVTGTFSKSDYIGALINGLCNDIAVTVLPNAPIDADTGLPVPTIAVATNGGVSVIKDNGSVVDIINTQDSSAFNYIDNLFFRKDGALVWVGDSASNTAAERFVQVLYNLPNVDINQGTVENSSVIDEQYGPSHKTGSELRWATTAGVKATSDAGENFAVGTSGALHLVKYNREVEQEGAIAHITSDYNTGYMHGDIKLATLSDTDTTNITGGNEITNGDAWSGASSSQSSTAPTGWTGEGGATWSTETGGDGSYIRLYNENNGGAGPNSYMHQTITTVVGKKYTISATQYHHATITVYVSAGTGPGSGNLLSISYNSSSGDTPKEVQGTFTATGTTTYINLGIISGTHNYSVGWDNIVVTESEPDRSYNANGLQVFGTVTKTAVATGADLVAYSGFSSSNYLEQPYNTDLDFNSGDFAYCFWSNNPATDAEYIGDRSEDNGNYRIALYLSANDNGTMNFYTRDTAATEVTGIIGSPNQWAQIWCIRRGTSHEIWVNGINKVASVGTVRDVSYASGDAVQKIGVRYSNTGANTGKIALFRVSATAPSPEQIAKIYNDEKHLFQENAKATLYGSSDAVTALAYDDDTELLHVGTSAGRSVFQGLRRVDNTTDAVGAAISASNGMVAED